MFNIIDQIFLEDALNDHRHGGNVVKSRAALNKAYGRIGRNGENDIDSDDSYDSSGNSPTYTEETEFGFVGLEAPLG